MMREDKTVRARQQQPIDKQPLGPPARRVVQNLTPTTYLTPSKSNNGYNKHNLLDTMPMYAE